jgi:hypothetical protein
MDPAIARLLSRQDPVTILLPAHLRDEAACLHEAIATEAKQRVNDCLPQHTRVKKPPGDTFSARGVDMDSESWLTLERPFGRFRGRQASMVQIDDSTTRAERMSKLSGRIDQDWS